MSEPAALEPEMGATGCKWYPGPLGAQLYIWLGGLRTFQLFYGESGGEREGERDRERETERQRVDSHVSPIGKGD